MLPAAAHDLGEVLTSERGRCTPALPSGAVLIDPVARELDQALVEAMRAAHEQQATLVLAFIGHGGFEDDDFYLMAKDSDVPPDSREAVLVGQRIKELLRRYSGLDGLVLLIDACHSGLAVESAGREWLQTMRRSRRRLELLTATDEGPAYGACATRTLTRLILTGSPRFGERLHFTEVKGYLDQHCGSQVAIHMAYDGSREVLVSDPAAWIAINPAWGASAVAGTAQQAMVEQLTSFYEQTDAFIGLLGLLERDTGHVVVNGPAGSGKSAAVAELAHPRTGVDVHAVVFLSGTESVEQVAVEMSRQLSGQLAGFDAAANRFWDTGLRHTWPQPAFEIHVLGPLRHLDRPVRIVVDGLDACESVAAEQLLAALTALPRHVQLVVTGDRATEAFPSARRIILDAASDDQITRYAERRDVDPLLLVRLSKGSWRAAHQLAEGLRLTSSLSAAEVPGDGYARQLRRAGFPRDEQVGAVLTVLLAAGPGAVVPIELLRTAAGFSELSSLRDKLFRLGPLVVRGRPGDHDEQVGLAGVDVANYLAGSGIDATDGHRALADAIPLVPSAAAYGIAARHRHLWACGRHDDAFAWVETVESVIPDENRVRWATLASWTEPGRMQRTARARAATWTAKAGDPAAALAVFEDLLAGAPEHDVETLSLHNNLTYWTGESGESGGWAQALPLAERLVTRCREVVGADHPETLSAMHLRALAVAKAGQVDEGLRGFREVLELRERVIGPTHIDTLRSRHNLLYWEAENTYPPPLPRSGHDSSWILFTLSGRITKRRLPRVTTRRCSGRSAARSPRRSRSSGTSFPASNVCSVRGTRSCGGSTSRSCSGPRFRAERVTRP